MQYWHINSHQYWAGTIIMLQISSEWRYHAKVPPVLAQYCTCCKFPLGAVPWKKELDKKATYKRSPGKKIPGKKVRGKKKSPEKKFQEKRLPAKRSPEKKSFSIEGMTVKFTEGSWTIFLFLSIDPARRSRRPDVCVCVCVHVCVCDRFWAGIGVQNVEAYENSKLRTQYLDR